MGWPIAKGGNRRDQNHARQISVASAPVKRAVCDAVHNNRKPDQRPLIKQNSGSYQVVDGAARANAGGAHRRRAAARKAFVNHF
jgi:hypothetical protein